MTEQSTKSPQKGESTMARFLVAAQDPNRVDAFRFHPRSSSLPMETGHWAKVGIFRSAGELGQRDWLHGQAIRYFARKGIEFLKREDAALDVFYEASGDVKVRVSRLA